LWCWGCPIVLVALVTPPPRLASLLLEPRARLGGTALLRPHSLARPALTWRAAPAAHGAPGPYGGAAHAAALRGGLRRGGCALLSHRASAVAAQGALSRPLARLRRISRCCR